MASLVGNLKRLIIILFGLVSWPQKNCLLSEYNSIAIGKEFAISWKYNESSAIPPDSTVIFDSILLLAFKSIIATIILNGADTNDPYWFSQFSYAMMSLL